VFALTKRGQTFVFDTLVDILCTKSRIRDRSDDSNSCGGDSDNDSNSNIRHVGGPILCPANKVSGLPQPGLFNRFWGGGGVKQMSIGLEHAAFVTHTGQLFCTGGNEWGQCGVEPPRQKGPMGAMEDRSRIEITYPMMVHMPDSAGPIEKVVVGGRHTVAWDASGHAFSFGDDRRIQLGLGDTRTGGRDERHALGVMTRDHLGGTNTKTAMRRQVSYRYYDAHMQASPVETMPPVVYNRPPYTPSTLFCCGEDFTLALHRDSPDWYSTDQETNVLVCCGENGEGQCGRSLQQQQQAWLPVRLPKRSRTAAIACGQGHSLALLSTGEVYAWGANSQGQVGVGTRAAVVTPVQVALDSSTTAISRDSGNSNGGSMVSTHQKRVSQIFCGFRNSAVILEKGGAV